jgi:hypothetical protein
LGESIRRWGVRTSVRALPFAEAVGERFEAWKRRYRYYWRLANPDYKKNYNREYAKI